MDKISDQLLEKVPCFYARNLKATTLRWEELKTLEENIHSIKCQFLNWLYRYDLDVFLLSAPFTFSLSVDELAAFCHTILYHLDPDHLAGFQEDPGWKYIVQQEALFVLCFSSLYPDSHSRQCYGNDKQTQILFQRYSSFDKNLKPGKNVIDLDQKTFCPVEF